ncbi:MAG: dipeptidase [Eubacterium ramulus]
MEKHADLIRPVRSYADIEQNQADGVMSALLTGEEGEITMGNPDFLDFLYKLGMRMMTLTWNYENSLGFPNVRLDKKASASSDRYCLSQNKGLKEQGIVFLEEMERLGMIIDVSHLSDAGFYDVLEHTTKPFVASHSNARSVCPAVRNLTDDMVRRLAERGGITGINFCKEFLGKPDISQNYLDQAVVHMKYLMNLGGEDFVALGSDFDGITRYHDLPDCSVMPKLVHTMKKAGLTPTQIEKICYKNTLRVYRELL